MNIYSTRLNLEGSQNSDSGEEAVFDEQNNGKENDQKEKVKWLVIVLKAQCIYSK